MKNYQKLELLLLRRDVFLCITTIFNSLKHASCFRLFGFLTNSILILGQAHDNDINVISSDSKYIYTASDNEIFAWKYGHRWVSWFHFDKIVLLFVC